MRKTENKPNSPIDAPNVDEELLVLERLTDLFYSKDAQGKNASHIIWHIIRLARHSEQIIEYSVHRPLGWSWAGFRIMINLVALGPVEPSKLAAVLGVSRPTITSTLNKLERGKYVRREKDPENGRRILVHLTKHGHQLVMQAVPEQQAVEKKLVATLSRKERAMLADMLNRLLVGMKEDDRI